MLVDASGKEIKTPGEPEKKEPPVLKGIPKPPEPPYFAVEIKTFTDSKRRQVIQRICVDGTPPPDFYEFQGIGDYQFIIPETNPPMPHDWSFPFKIQATNVKEAYANFDSCMHAKEAMETAYMAFKTQCSMERAQYEAQQKARDMAELKRNKADIEARTPNLARMRRRGVQPKAGHSEAEAPKAETPKTDGKA